MRATTLILCIAALLVGEAALAAPPTSPAIPILKRALETRDRATVEKAKEDIQALLVKRPKDGIAHYVHGRILSLLGDDNGALRAYDVALKHAPKLADAQYNAGVVLLRLKREEEALKRFYAAGEMDPRLIDAFYNAGQMHYNRGEFAKALERWQRARKAAPKDFGVLKKVVQALNALNRYAAAEKAKKQLFAMRKSSRNPRVQKLREVVIDQFKVGAYHVYAYETFEPTGNLYYLYTCKVTKGGKIAFTVQLESSAVIREMGTPYVIGVTKGRKHKTTGRAFKKLPPWGELKPALARVIEQEVGS